MTDNNDQEMKVTRAVVWTRLLWFELLQHWQDTLQSDLRVWDDAKQWGARWHSRIRETKRAATWSLKLNLNDEKVCHGWPDLDLLQEPMNQNLWGLIWVFVWQWHMVNACPEPIDKEMASISSLNWSERMTCLSVLRSVLQLWVKPWATLR